MAQFRLLGQRRFLPFFVTQFLGAFNDNVYKNAVVILIAFSGLEPSRADMLVNLAAGVFILPYFLFSATAGQLADKHEKSSLIRIIKAAEIGIMACAVVGLLTKNVVVLLVVLFLMGAQSTAFGPVKYSILPQQLREHELVGGNGLVEMGTFVAILIGTIAGGLLVAHEPFGPIMVSAAVVAFALLGWLASRAIPAAQAQAPELRVRYEPLRETWRLMSYARSEPVVFIALVGNSWFWFYGAVFLAQFPGYARSLLGANEQVVTLMLTAFSVGIGIGSTLCERLTRGRIELGLVLLGALGLTGFAVDLYFASPTLGSERPAAELLGALAFLHQPGALRIVADLVLIGVFGGWFIVPLYTMMQHRSAPDHRSRVIAANNVLNALFMVAASVLAIALRALGVGIAELLLLTGLGNALMAVLLAWWHPEFLTRFVVWTAGRVLLRIRPRGLELVPAEGAALLRCDDVGPLATLVLGAMLRRPMRFVRPAHWQPRGLLRLVLRHEGELAGPDEVERALADGALVVVWNEEPVRGAAPRLRASLSGQRKPRRAAEPVGFGALVARQLGRRLRLELGPVAR